MFYNFPVLDTSQISVLNMGTELNDYKVDVTQRTELNNFVNEESFFVNQVV